MKKAHAEGRMTSRSARAVSLVVTWAIIGLLCYLLGHVRPERFCAGCAGMCAALLLLFLAAGEYCPVVFRQNFSLGWGGICLCLLAFGARQCRFIQKRYAL